MAEYNPDGKSLLILKDAPIDLTINGGAVALLAYSVILSMTAWLLPSNASSAMEVTLAGTRT